MRRLLKHLACPHCHGDLVERHEEFLCEMCAAAFPIHNGKIYFIEPVHGDDVLDMVKGRFKKTLGSAYNKITKIIGPSYPFDYDWAVLSRIDPVEQLVVDIGSGNHRIDINIITLDSSDYDSVDIVADLGSLPFKAKAIDALCSCSVLEHVADLVLCLKEITRVTRSNGLGIHNIPFMYPFHASPHDYTRLTHYGAARLFTGWKLIEQRNVSGPISLFLICFIEFMSVLLSFGIQRLKAPIYLLLCLFTFPIKVLDAPFIGRKSFLGLAPTILTVVIKP